MFQIWRYRTSWQEISTPLHHDSRFFWHFLGVMVSGVTKYGQDLDWHQWVQLDMRELLTYAVWCHYSRRMTSSWQHDNSGGHFLDQCSVSSPGLYSGYSHIMYAVLLLPRYPSSVSVWGQHLQFTQDWTPGPLELPRSQSAASPYPFHYRHNNNMHWAQAKMILFGLSLSLSCPEWLMRQNESLTLHLGLILGLTGAGRKCQNVDTRLGIDVNFLPRIPTHVFRHVVGGGAWPGWSPCCHACAGAKLPLQQTF